ncbi:uncharacterized protein LOC101771486 isoform X2 [Setaria italica]|uniref:uncharacterized protein LOC101771486 isoform X2 n=1 Tax=Setaria italica TaxID=4555 RepID=UPI000BE5FF09|nr:uncharacterized protein LOC101771486 isoform X2 [Setaria italica]XP_034572199.1 uncharacterized protein LOC117836804 isoform X3 [Setaria viridis]
MPIAAGVWRGSSSGVRPSSGALTTACPPLPPAAHPARPCAPIPRAAPAAATRGSSAGTSADARTGWGRSVHPSHILSSPSSSTHLSECWLKKQKDVMAPAVVARGEDVMWTSGLVFGKGEGIVELETNIGTLHIQLLPGCAPRSVDYFIELLGLRNCAGCRFYRAEGRGNVWDAKGNHERNAAFGPPYALLQGTLEVDGVPFKGIAREACPAVKRGSIAWVGPGPEFLISLANHEEWKDAYTVFGHVLPEDMGIAEEMALLPSSTDVWSNVTVKVLRDPVYFKVKRSSHASSSV